MEWKEKNKNSIIPALKSDSSKELTCYTLCLMKNDFTHYSTKNIRDHLKRDYDKLMNDPTAIQFL